MLSKIVATFDSLKTNWSTDSAARGAAKMAMGAALLAEGIFGFVRGSRSGSSLLGALAIGVGAVVFTLIGLHTAPEEYPDAARIKGQVSEVHRVRDSDRKYAYSPVYSYVVNGETYTMSSALTTSKRPTLGSSVDIVYSAAEPSNAYREDGMDGWFSWIFLGCGIFLAIWAAYALIVSIIMIVVGFILFRGGRKDRIAAGEGTDFIKDLISLAMKTKKAE